MVVAAVVVVAEVVVIVAVVVAVVVVAEVAFVLNRRRPLLQLQEIIQTLRQYVRTHIHGSEEGKSSVAREQKRCNGPADLNLRIFFLFF